MVFDVVLLDPAEHPLSSGSFGEVDVATVGVRHQRDVLGKVRQLGPGDEDGLSNILVSPGFAGSAGDAERNQLSTVARSTHASSGSVGATGVSGSGTA